MGVGRARAGQRIAAVVLCLLAWALCGEAWAGSTYDCMIEPMRTVDIGSPVGGMLGKVYVERGSRVHKGEVIASLESSAETAAANLALYKSQLMGPTDTAQDKLKYAQAKYDRRKNMHDEDFMSAQDMDDAENEVGLAQAELETAKEDKEMARLEWVRQKSMLDERTFHSPFDGVVVDVNLYPGEVVEPSGEKKTIMKLAELDPLRVYVILPMAVFGRVKKGMHVVVAPEQPVGGHYTGKVFIIDRVVNAASGTFGVFVRLPNPRLALPAGVRCRATFPIQGGYGGHSRARPAPKS